MKKLVDLVKVIENNRECVILEVTGTKLDLIKLGCFNGDEVMMRLTKGDSHTCTVWTKDGHYSWNWGTSGNTIVSDSMKKRGKLIQECVEEDLEIYIGGNPALITRTLYIKSIGDVKHNHHTMKLMYWSSSKNRVSCHLDGAFHKQFDCDIYGVVNHFEGKGYDVTCMGNYVAQTGCIVYEYEMER